MSSIVFLVIKIAVLVVLYLFLFKVFKLMISDIQYSSRKATKPLPPGVTGQLSILESDDPVLRPGDVLMLKQVQTTIGRGKHNNIKLENTYISHNHARIIFQDNEFYVEDLGSINGTYVNGIKLDSPVIIHRGDVIKIAGNVFKFAG